MLCTATRLTYVLRWRHHQCFDPYSSFSIPLAPIDRLSNQSYLQLIANQCNDRELEIKRSSWSAQRWLPTRWRRFWAISMMKFGQSQLPLPRYLLVNGTKWLMSAVPMTVFAHIPELYWLSLTQFAIPADTEVVSFIISVPTPPNSNLIIVFFTRCVLSRLSYSAVVRPVPDQLQSQPKLGAQAPRLSLYTITYSQTPHRQSNVSSTHYRANRPP